MMTGVDGNGPKRFSVQRKMAIVARLLRGETPGQTLECAFEAAAEIDLQRTNRWCVRPSKSEAAD
jgi:hypothetical protein